MPVGIARYDYKANQDNPGGFTELSLHKSRSVMGPTILSFHRPEWPARGLREVCLHIQFNLLIQHHFSHARYQLR